MKRNGHLPRTQVGAVTMRKRNYHQFMKIEVQILLNESILLQISMPEQGASGSNILREAQAKAVTDAGPGV